MDNSAIIEFKPILNTRISTTFEGSLGLPVVDRQENNNSY